MQTNRVMIAILLTALILTSSMTYFGQDSFSAYAKPFLHLKILQKENHPDLPKIVVTPKPKLH